MQHTGNQHANIPERQSAWAHYLYTVLYYSTIIKVLYTYSELFNIKIVAW